MAGGDSNTRSGSYTEYLVSLQTGRIKSLLGPINPYRHNIRRLCVGRVLDVGCGIGRNLGYLDRPDAMGVDHNPNSVAFARNLGHDAIETPEFLGRFGEFERSFDTILLSHVLEHLTLDDAVELVRAYLPALSPGGRVVAVCPQERGFASEKSHINYLAENDLRQLGELVGLQMTNYMSFPLPRIFGKMWIFNEHIAVYSAPVAA